MFARTSTWAGTPEALKKWDVHTAATVRPFVEGLEGNAGAMFFIDWNAAHALTLTLWESEAAAVATDRFADQSRDSTIAATGMTLLSRGQYEVVSQ
jgi:hypothetical protein